MQQNQIIIGVLTGYCCCIRPPVWISHLNGFCASTHDVIVRYHALWCNEETSSGYCRLWFWRRPTGGPPGGRSLTQFTIARMVTLPPIQQMAKESPGRAGA